jgi:hypothetical protein
MKKYLKIAIVTICILVAVYIGLIHYIFNSPDIPGGAEILPEEVLMEKRAPNNKLLAQILIGEKIEGFNPLGSNERYYLSIKHPSSQYLVLRDLSEGFGSYEGGVMDLKWLDSEHICIERVVGDQRSDLIYDLESHLWLEPEK